MELEKKSADLKGELENALKENVLLQKQVNELSESQSLSNTVEMQKKEVKILTFFICFVLYFTGNVLMEIYWIWSFKAKSYHESIWDFTIKFVKLLLLRYLVFVHRNKFD